METSFIHDKLRNEDIQCVNILLLDIVLLYSFKFDMRQIWNMLMLSSVFVADVSPCAGQQTHQTKWYVDACSAVD